MARFYGRERPSTPMAGSAALIGDFAVLGAARVAADEGIGTWAARVSPSWLAGHVSWHSAAAGREIGAPGGLLVTHFFDHQTHHRGQAHALITAAGGSTGDTTCSWSSPRLSPPPRPPGVDAGPNRIAGMRLFQQGSRNCPDGRFL